MTELVKTITTNTGYGEEGGYYGTTFQPNYNSCRLGYSSSDRNIFIWHQNVTIPKGSTIDSAVISIMANTDNSSSVNLKIYIENSDNPSQPSSINDINQRTYTSGIDWDESNAWTAGQRYTTPNFKNDLQTIINRDGWKSGQNILILIKNDGGNSYKDITQEDKGVGYGSILTVNYSEGITPPATAIKDLISMGIIAFPR